MRTPATGRFRSHWSSATIDEKTGLLASNNCPPMQVRVEYFVPGTQPTDYCPLHATGPQKALRETRQGIRRIFESLC